MAGGRRTRDRDPADVRARILVACVAEHDWSGAPPSLDRQLLPGDSATVVDAVDFHRVVGCVLQSVRHLLPEDSPLVASLQPLYMASLQSHLRVLAELPVVAAALDRDRIPWMVLKGPVLAEAIYRRPDLRTYGDLDVLVLPEDFGRALSCLEEAGYRVQDRNWDLLRHRMLGEVQLASPRGTPIDLHWHPLNELALRRVFRFDAATLFGDARTVELGARSVRAASAAHTLVHLAVHGASGGGNRLLWLKDLEQSILFDRPSWDDVVDVAGRWQAGLVCALMLRRAGRALGAPVSGDVVRELENGASWGQLASFVDRLAPVERSLGRRSVARAVARATRADDRSSMVALGGAAVEALREGRLDLAPPAPDPDPRSPESIYHQGGGNIGRARFLAAVSATARLAVDLDDPPRGQV